MSQGFCLLVRRTVTNKGLVYVRVSCVNDLLAYPAISGAFA